MVNTFSLYRSLSADQGSMCLKDKYQLLLKKYNLIVDSESFYGNSWLVYSLDTILIEIGCLSTLNAKECFEIYYLALLKLISKSFLEEYSQVPHL